MNMDRATFESFKSQGYNRIPVVREVLADTDTPLSTYLKLENFRAGIRGSEKDYIPGNEMQASVARLSDAEIDDLVETIAGWKVIENDHTIEGDLGNGQALYANCAACHGADGQGNEALGAPGLVGRNDWYMFRQIKLFKSGYRGVHPDDTAGRLMRPSTQSLKSDQDVNDVLVYINSLDR